MVAAMAAWSAREMRWGEDDCALACANVLAGVLGYDPAAPWRGEYESRAGAYALLGGEHGLCGAMMYAAGRHGWREIAPAAAQPGDLGLVLTPVRMPRRQETPLPSPPPQGGREPAADGGTVVLAMVICRAPGWFVGRNERGFSAVRAAHVQQAWSVV